MVVLVVLAKRVAAVVLEQTGALEAVAVGPYTLLSGATST